MTDLRDFLKKGDEQSKMIPVHDYLKSKSKTCVTHHAPCGCVGFKLLDGLLDIEHELSIGHSSMAYVKVKELREYLEKLYIV